MNDFMADKKTPRGIWTTFEKQGGKVVKKNKYCPKCGPGFTLAKHKDRQVCGACGYAEFFKAA